MTVSERLAEFITGLRFEDLPAPIVEKAKDHLIYHVGLALGGHAGDDGATAIRLAQSLSAGSEDATIFGAAHGARPLDAAFANSALMSFGHLDDTVEPSGLHPAVVVHPAAWAFAECGGRSGRELITAVIIGYEVMCKLADPIGTFQSYARRVQYPFAPFGVAAASARLLGLDPHRTAEAMGHAAHAGMGVVEGSEFAWSVQARLARAGMLSALLAEAGARAARTTIEGAHGFYQAFFASVPVDLDESLDTLGREFAIAAATTKPFSASGVNIIAMQLTQELRTSGAFGAEDVQSVRVVLSDDRRTRDAYYESEFDRPDATPEAAKGSLRFRIASILLDGRIDLSRYESFRSPEVQAMVRRITLDYESGHTMRVGRLEAPNTTYGRVEIATRDGRTHRAERDRFIAPRGDWHAWLRRGGERLLSDEQLARAEEMLSHLEDVDDTSEVLSCLRQNVDRRAPSTAALVRTSGV